MLYFQNNEVKDHRQHVMVRLQHYISYQCQIHYFTKMDYIYILHRVTVTAWDQLIIMCVALLCSFLRGFQ